MTPSHEQLDAWMELALAEARQAVTHGDVPIGAVLVDPAGNVVASDHNHREERKDALAHAEMLVLGAAAGSADWRLTDHTLVVTLEPCAMCAGAIQQARLGHLVYGTADLKTGACWSLYNIPQDARLNHRVEMTAGIRADECSSLLSRFFADRR
ncbi:MAG TPA: nucleoside deaminase [Acidimicrobiia bacterium]